MENIVALITTPPSFASRRDDDFTDRLSSRYTVLLLCVFATVVTLQVSTDSIGF